MLAWEFVDLAELPQVRVNGFKEPSTLGGSDYILVVRVADVMKQRKLISDITTWTECYATQVNVMAMQWPQFVPELLAYLRTIIRASRQFRCPSWVIYDANFRRQVTAGGVRDWS